MQSIQNLLTSTTSFTMPDMQEFIVQAVLLLIMTQLLAFTYRKFGETLSNRTKLSRLFSILALTTMMIISIIKSSIALSLGLVGALSIVRFRSAIKEPEELAYIFLSITLGLGMGAGQPGVTVAFFAIIFVFLLARAILKGKVNLPGLRDSQQLYLQVQTKKESVNLSELLAVLKKHTSEVALKRADESSTIKEFFLSVLVSDAAAVESLTSAVKKLDTQARVTVISHETSPETV